MLRTIVFVFVSVPNSFFTVVFCGFICFLGGVEAGRRNSRGWSFQTKEHFQDLGFLLG